MNSELNSRDVHPQNQIAYGKNLTSTKSSNLEKVANKNLFCHKTIQKPIHKFPFFGEAETDAFLSLPLGGVGRGLCLIDSEVSIKPLTGPALSAYLTNKKTHLYFGVERRSTKRKVQTIINRSLLFGSPFGGNPAGKGVINFYKMKKQILFFAMITLAFIFAGTTKSFGQALSPRTTPNPIDPLSCIANSLPLHPVPGVPYRYEMDGTTGEEQTSNWTWFATKDTTFLNTSGVNIATMLTAPGDLLSVSANYGVSTLDADTVSITWSAEILALTEYEGTFQGLTPTVPSPTFVVAYAEGINCADNIEVYEINPAPAFIVDIANIDEGGATLDWDVDTAECVDVVRSATYNDVSKTMLMDYGTDTIYFEVVASNFVTNWTPTLTITAGLSGSQLADIGIASSYANAQSGTWITGTTEETDMFTADSTSFNGIDLTASDPADVNDGVSVFVRVVIHNNTYESLTSQDFILSVDGQDATGQWDIAETDCADPTNADYDTDDSATQTMRPRPTIDGTPNTGTTTVDENPAAVDPSEVIDKERN